MGDVCLRGGQNKATSSHGLQSKAQKGHHGPARPAERSTSSLDFKKNQSEKRKREDDNLCVVCRGDVLFNQKKRGCILYIHSCHAVLLDLFPFRKLPDKEGLKPHAVTFAVVCVPQVIRCTTPPPPNLPSPSARTVCWPLVTFPHKARHVTVQFKNNHLPKSAPLHFHCVTSDFALIIENNVFILCFYFYFGKIRTSMD